MTNATEIPDIYRLDRFSAAQRDVYATALAELRRGRKASHWMWFVLPQIQGLGSSEMARRYAVSGIEEARAYLAHPVLGLRLLESVGALLLHRGSRAAAILGELDALKLRSCLTLFTTVAPATPVFREALHVFFNDSRDPTTLEILLRTSARES